MQARRHSTEHRRFRAERGRVRRHDAGWQDAGRSMGPATRWETAPVPGGGTAARTLNPPGTGRQPASHGSCTWVGSPADIACLPSPSHIPSDLIWVEILPANVKLSKSDSWGTVLLCGGPCASAKLGHFFVPYLPTEQAFTLCVIWTPAVLTGSWLPPCTVPAPLHRSPRRGTAAK